MRFVSVSRKDRGAILPIGRTKGDVYWWAPGLFTTSTYYGDTLPTWVQQFNAERGWMQLAGKSWDLLLPAASYSEPDSVPAEAQGGQFMFPYRAPRDSATLARIFFGTPMMDSLSLALALRAVSVKELGAAPRRSDLLAVSLSSTDAVGHKFGPDSREIHDQLLRLDRSLGAFFDSLFVLRDPRRVTVVLTGDHGMSPLPEFHSGRFANQGASRVDAGAVLAAIAPHSRGQACRSTPSRVLSLPACSPSRTWRGAICSPISRRPIPPAISSRAGGCTCSRPVVRRSWPPRSSRTACGGPPRMPAMACRTTTMPMSR
jgi:hypothetical protein